MNPQQQHEYDQAQQAGWNIYCDNIPVATTNLLQFWNELKRKMPELIVREGRANTQVHASDRQIKAYHALDLTHVKQPDEVVGQIGYDKYDDQYVVTSRLIENARFSRWSSEHRTQRSKHMNKMLKVAKQVLVPKRLDEVCRDSGDKFLSRVANIRDTAYDSMRGKINRINVETWRNELLNMHKQGYTPTNQYVQEAVVYILETQDEYDHLVNYDPQKAYVWIKPDEVQYQLFKSKNKPDGDVITVSSVDELPEEIREKIFVLMITDQMAFVKDLGMKEADNKFWVLL